MVLNTLAVSAKARRARKLRKRCLWVWNESGEVGRGWTTENLLGRGARGETESCGLFLMCDFSFLFYLPSFLPSISPNSSPHSFPHPPLATLLVPFHLQENKNQLFHCVPCLCWSAGFGAGDALWCHWAGSRHLDLWAYVLPGPDLSGCPTHNSIDFSPVLHLTG